MLRKQIITYINNQIEEIDDHLQPLDLPQSKDAVHDVRVCIKRIRAFLKLFDLKKKNKKIRKLLKKPLKSIFRAAGNIRDIEVQITLLADYENLLEKKFHVVADYLGKKSEKKRSILRTLLERIPKDVLHTFQEEVVREIESVQERRLNKLIVKSLKKITIKSKKSKNRFLPASLHKQRKLLKEIRFCFEMTGDISSNLHTQAQISEIKEVEDILGKWHDYNLFKRLVERVTQRLKKSDVEIVINLNMLMHAISNDIILMLEKYRRMIPALKINPEISLISPAENN